MELVAMNGDISGQLFRLSEGDSKTIGRAPSQENDNAHISIADHSVSRFHCRIEVRQGVARIEDVRSLHGTFVNGCRVEHGPLALNPGDIISIGEIKLLFQG